MCGHKPRLAASRLNHINLALSQLLHRTQALQLSHQPPTGRAAAAAALAIAAVAGCRLQHTLQLPTLLHALLGKFVGRAVAMSSLAEELGLPWQLLERLLVVRAGVQASSADMSDERQLLQFKEQLMSEVEQTLKQAQDADPTAKWLRTGAYDAL